MSIDDYVSKLLYSSTYIRSVDGFLVKLSSIAYDIEGRCSGGLCDPLKLFEELVYSERLIDLFSQLSCYAGEVENSIASDPRHRILKRYLDIIARRLSELKCAEGRQYEVSTPAPTWLKEEYEGRAAMRERPIAERTAPKLRTDLEGVLKALLVVSLLLTAISAIILFIGR